ncbi:hypothetical protein SALB1_0884 [Salinisphaera sp. LB1]|nr:hypothetical protein SALB1_0884 [Salinisphaera sp. LB1]
MRARQGAPMNRRATVDDRKAAWGEKAPAPGDTPAFRALCSPGRRYGRRPGLQCVSRAGRPSS